ncbi:CHAT domain-containing protein [Ephemerocybe angulata]|uniref:CHAT domain-containing protein n=1 Tax=Ephemerocybe angulata TaxID=980116 RepID=A0A8H6LUZ1_9AGAR|nr:CHAT domain-containing protein [Tulosesus angulatus]
MFGLFLAVLNRGTALFENNEGAELQGKFDNTGYLAHIDGAISAHRRAVQHIQESHGEMALYASDLAWSLYSRFNRTGNLRDVDEAIAMHRRATRLTSEGDSDMPGRLNNLGIALEARFQHTGDLRDIDEAITTQQRAVRLAPGGHVNLPGWINSLGISLLSRSQRTGDLRDLEECISTKQRALRLTPQGDKNMPAGLSTLGNAYAVRFGRTSDLHDLNEAITLQQRAVKLTPEGHAHKPGWLNNVGYSLQARYENTGDPCDIDESISVYQRAVQLTPEGHVDLPLYLNNLGIAFQCRFAHNTDLCDIAESIAAKQRAVQLTPEGHALMPGRLSNLGNAFESRFHYTGDLRDIDEAITAQQRAVQLIPPGHTEMHSVVGNLGNALQCRFDRSADLRDIAEAIAVKQRALRLTPEGHEMMPGRLGNLGNAFDSRFQRSGALSDIDEAILLMQRALNLSPEGHADLPSMMRRLGLFLHRRYTANGSHTDLEASISSFKLAANCNSGSPRQKLDAATRWAHLLIRHFPASHDILTAFDTAIRLIALIAGVDKTIEGRYNELRESPEFVLLAASSACLHGRPDKALEWLESGRCLVWSQFNELRTPLDELRLRDSALAQRLLDISRRLEAVGTSRSQVDFDMPLSQKISLEEEARAHRKLGRERDDLLRVIRDLPGFEAFLQPSPSSALMSHLPKSGYIVVIIVEERRCDAIALSARQDKPLHIPLPNFSLAKCNKHRNDLRTQLRSRNLRDRGETMAVLDDGDGERGIRSAIVGRHGEPATQAVLRALWEEVVSPILKKLEISKMDRSSTAVPPRIWWCPTGSLSFLPLHAAGIYGSGKFISESVLDYAVSSYTPTITTLTERVKNSRSIDRAVSGLFITSQPNAPGGSPIPGTTKEVRSIYDMATESGTRVKKLEGSAITINECLDYMGTFSSIHLACHASQNAADPLKSRFLFHNGTLELGTIIQRNLKDADLAFLSACQTSTGEENLSDEAVHLAAGMLAAGYRRVVATMWSIGDRYAPEIAKDFHQYLQSHRHPATGHGFDGTDSAYALHHAIQQLRLRLNGDTETALLAWIPYVHFGF